MKIEHFEEQLQEIDRDLSITPNKNNSDLAAVNYRGSYLFAIPNHNIYEQPNNTYGVELPNRKYVRHRTTVEALAMAKAQVYKIKNDQDYEDALMGKGQYSDQALGINMFAPANTPVEENVTKHGIIIPKIL